MERPQSISGIEDKNSFRGTIKSGGHQYQWRQNETGEVMLRNSNGHYCSLGEYTLRDEQQLQLVNALLAQFRPNAMPDENGYFAASAVVTAGGQLFLGVNNEVHIKDPFSGRGCAETSALRKSMEATQDPHVQLRKIYLMSGMAAKQRDGSLVESAQGHMGCPCGECRDNLRSHADKNTRFIMLPTNSGKEKLTINRTADVVAHVPEGQAWEISYDKMYPLPEHITRQAIADTVKEGFLAIKRSEAGEVDINPVFSKYLHKAEQHGSVNLSAKQIQDLAQAYAQVDFSVPALAIDPALENINREMVKRLKAAYREHAAHVPAGKNLKIIVVMLKTEEGKFYPGVSVVGDGWLPSKPPAFATALSNANNHVGFSDVYMMTFDEQQLLREMSAGSAMHSHDLPMPNAAALNRTIKNLGKTGNALLTVIPINNGLLSGEELEKMAYVTRVRDAFGPDFQHAKGQVAAARAH